MTIPLAQTCSVPECHRRAHGQGLCNTHYGQARHNGNLTPEYRIDNVGRWRDYAPTGQWAEQAACRGAPNLFVEPLTKHSNRPVALTPWVRRAITICNNCAVKRECREWALSVPDPCVRLVAGGLTTSQREQIRERKTA